MTILQIAALRFRIDPRDVPADKAARVLGPTIAAFSAALPRLQNRGFPAADPDTGNYDLKAIEAWIDRRSGLADFRVCSRSTARRMVHRLCPIVRTIYRALALGVGVATGTEDEPIPNEAEVSGRPFGKTRFG